MKMARGRFLEAMKSPRFRIQNGVLKEEIKKLFLREGELWTAKLLKNYTGNEEILFRYYRDTMKWVPADLKSVIFLQQ